MEQSRLKEELNKEFPEANLAIARPLLFVGCGAVLLWLLFEMKIFHTLLPLARVTLIPTAMLLIGCSILCRIKEGKSRWLSYVILHSLLLSCFFINVLTGYKTSALFIFPVVLSLRYGKRFITFSVALFASLYLFACAFCEAFLANWIGFLDLNTVSFANAVSLTVKGYMYDEVIKAGTDHLILFLNFLKLSTLPDLIEIWLVSLAAMISIQNNDKKMKALIDSSEREKKLELDLQNTKTKAVMSQIQPHFLYNTISSIMSIDGNPEETVDALGEFGKYLRENLDSITGSELIPIQKELQHVERYLSLEKLRFGENIKCFISQKVSGFNVPALSVQVLAENAVKHGITKRRNGGSIWIETGSTEQEYFVRVSDDGVGFETDPPQQNTDSKTHVGLENLQMRLNVLCEGSFEIRSAPGKGTIAVIHIPKNQEGNK